MTLHVICEVGHEDFKSELICRVYVPPQLAWYPIKRLAIEFDSDGLLPLQESNCTRTYSLERRYSWVKDEGAHNLDSSQCLNPQRLLTSSSTYKLLTSSKARHVNVALRSTIVRSKQPLRCTRRRRTREEAAIRKVSIREADKLGKRWNPERDFDFYYWLLAVLLYRYSSSIRTANSVGCAACLGGGYLLLKSCMTGHAWNPFGCKFSLSCKSGAVPLTWLDLLLIFWLSHYRFRRSADWKHTEYKKHHHCFLRTLTLLWLS